MFEYLVTSKTRRRLLEWLWRDHQSGTASELARHLDCAFAGVYKELQAMEDTGLATSTWDGKHRFYQADHAHPLGDLLEKLLKESTGQKRAIKRDAVVLEKLAYLGLPVSGLKRAPRAADCVEELLVLGATYAREDPTTARAFPVVLWKLRGKLNFKLVEKFGRKRGQKQNVGFLLELTGKLGGDHHLVTEARAMRDHRRRRPQHYFRADSDYAQSLAEFRTPRLARDWGWLMNVGYDAFESTFEKFNRDPTSI